MSSDQEMSNVTKLPSGTSSTKEGGEEPRRIHLRDITADTPLDGDAVGVTLRKARLKTGEDLKSVSDKLRIRRPYLEALEESRHDDLPGRPYAIGFVRSYAAHLGLKADETVGRYKAETRPEDEEADSAVEQFSFPEVREETRLPKGSLLILAVLLGAAIYGAWLLSISADKMVSDRVPPVPEQLGSVAPGDEQTSVTAPMAPLQASAPELPGDSAAAAVGTGALPEAPEALVSTRPVAADVAPVSPSVPAATIDEAATPPVEEVATSAEVDVAALAPLAMEPSVTIADDLALAVGGARVYGLENEGARVVVRATKPAWLRIEAGDGSVLLNQTLSEGEMYRAPLGRGAIFVARDAGAFELYVDGQNVGPAGPSGLVLTGKSLNPDDLLRR